MGVYRVTAGVTEVCCFFLLMVLFLPPGRAPCAEGVRIVIEGLEGRPLENVRAFLSLPPGLVGPGGKVDETLFEQFQKRVPDAVEEALRPFGYYSPEVRLRTQPEGGGYRLSVFVKPGKQVVVISADVKVEGPGAGEAQLRKAVEAWPLKRGSVLLSAEYEKAKTNLQAQARALGYVDADFPVHVIDVYKSAGAADIRLTLATGERYYFGAVTLSDAPRYPDVFVRRYLMFKAGDVFSDSRLTRTRTNLYNADRFREVFIKADKVAATDHAVPVEIDLVPSPERRIRTGAGYGTDTGPRFLVRYQDVNVLEKGHEFRADLNISQLLYGVTAAYIVPSEESHRNFTALRFTLLRETPVTYQSNVAALEIGRERGFGENTQGVAFLRLAEERYTIGGTTDSSFLVLPGLRLYAQYYDSPVRPRSGYRYGIEVRGTDRWLGSTTGLFQGVPVADVLIPLPLRLTVLLRSQGGFTLQRGAFENIPASLRFFAGGDRNVRGYSYQALGPRDSTGTVVGGKYLLFGSIEVERAIAADWGIAGFYDAGNAFDSLSNVSLAESAGIGIHYYSRFGPFRLDIAQQLNGPNLARRIHLTMGIFL